MNLATELTALVIRQLSANGTISQPDPINDFVSVLFTGKSSDVRQAEALVATAGTAVASAKRMITNRKFKKIIQHV